MTSRWNEAMLDDMRQKGDPVADNVITKLFENGGVFAVSSVMKTLVSNDHPAPELLPEELRDYLNNKSQIPRVDPARVEGGQRLFHKFGPEILMVLATYSVPASYTARNGVQVLYRTGYLNNRANRRLFETTQMVVDVLTPGGLDSKGKGVRTAQKVRLMHAAIRQLILSDPENPWDSTLGVPINQEDLAGTLMTFTHLIMEGLNRLGITVSEDEQQGYLETWKVIGRLMGIEETLIPSNPSEAKTLCDLIQQRQVRICPEGKKMNDALLKMLEAHAPMWPLTRWPAALMRYFLPAEVANGLCIPRRAFEEKLLQRAALARKRMDPLEQEANRKLGLIRKFSLTVIKFVVAEQQGGKRTPFVIPVKLNEEWSRSRRMSVWQQLRRR